MTHPVTPWFHHSLLARRFSQSLQLALDTQRITAAQRLWLQRLIDDQEPTPATLQPLPRVDQVVIDANLPLGSELSGAWVISDPQDAHAPIILDTLLNGVEAFADRQALNQALIQRYLSYPGSVQTLELQHVEGNPFVQRMHTLVGRQVAYLDTLGEQLEQLPSLHTAIGTHLQQLWPDPAIKVFKHQVQRVVQGASGEPVVVATQSLVDAAFEDFGQPPARAASLSKHRFLDATGAVLDQQRAQQWAALLAGVSVGLAECYEDLLGQFWGSPGGFGATRREFAARALAEAFAHELLQGWATHALGAAQMKRLAVVLSNSVPDPALYTAWQPSLILDAGATPKLAGVFVVELAGTEQAGFYLFSALDGLRHFASRALLDQYFRSAEGRAQWLELTSLNEHQAFSSQAIARVRLDAIDQPLFGKMLDSIIALHKRNLQHVLSLPAIHPQRCAVRVDDALDVRRLLDRRLVYTHDDRRWSAGAEPFARRWAPAHTVLEYSAGQLDTTMYSPEHAWHGQLGSLDLFQARQCERYDKLAGCMRQTLNRYLAVAGKAGLDARDLWVQVEGEANSRLISLALERVSGHTSGPLPPGSRLLADDVAAELSPGSLLPPDVLDWMLEQAKTGFIARYEQHLGQFLTRPLRWLDTQVRPGHTQSLIREAAFYLELAMARRQQAVDPAVLDMLAQVLERPLRSQRKALAEQRVEVHRLRVLYDPQQPALALSNVLVFTQTALPGRHLLWSLCSNLSEYASVAILEKGLAGRFESSIDRADWMALLSADDQRRLQAHLDSLSGGLHLQVQLQRLDEHFVDTLQDMNLHLRCAASRQALVRALPWKLPADNLRQMLHDSECNDPARQWLDRLGVSMEIMLTDALLPEWMRNASIWQLFEMSAYIERWYVACYSAPDFLFGIPEPGEFVRERLQSRFAEDFPGQTLDPDRITVSLTHYTAMPVAIGEIPAGVPAATERQSTSLTDYVIGRFAARQDGIVSVTVDDSPPGQAVITPQYLHDLVRELDVGSAYRSLLNTKFTPGQPGYAARRRYYSEQVPPLELLRTYAMRVRNELSQEGFEFIETILTMPEAAIRLPVRQRAVFISPLQLRAAPGLVPDRVLGAFIIAPQAPQSGPWLLYMLFNADFHVQEYASQAALLHDIHTDTNLQQFMLSRLPVAARRLYEHGGFVEPHLPFSTESGLDVPWQTPAPVALAIEPIMGNALHALFASTGEVLQWWFAELSVTNAEQHWAATKFLWTLGAEQVLALLPGRLGALVGVWQSQSLLRESAADVVQLQWGRAAAELMAAVAVLLTTRRSTERELPETPEVPDTSDLVQTQLPAFGWRNNSLTPELWSRLRPYQVADLDITALVKDPLVNTYRDAGSGWTYASVMGAMYRIETDEQSWFIVGEQGRGPRIFMRDGQWHLNLQLGLRGGGGMLTRIKSGLVNAEVEQVLIIEATGMNEIRRKFRTHARDIAQAHALAREYLENGLDNLDHRTPDGQYHSLVASIVRDFFSVSSPQPSLYALIRQSLQQMHAALIDDTLSPLDSQRYVVGLRRSMLDEVTAFSIPVEPAKRIYLTERFFRDPVCRLKPHVLAHGRFNQGRHHRATVLIHELSHLYCATEDMAYIDAHVPFIDLLEDHSEYRRAVKNEIILQQAALSWRTPPEELFRIQRADGLWYDLSDRKAKNRILQVTGKRSLEEARQVFYADDRVRSEVILANADSVALLATQLGRERLVV